MQQLSDQEIVDLVISGQVEAFAEFLRRYRNLVQHIVARMVANRADREDLGQETFLRIYHNLSDFRFASKLSTWVAKIAHNTCINYLQKKRVPLLEDQSPEEADAVPAFERVASSDRPPDEQIAEQDITLTLRHAIDRLPVHYRTAVTLFHLEELSYAEISEIMELPEGTVKSYLFRARQMLRHELKGTFVVEAIGS